MNFEELVIRNRSYRRFDESKRLDRKTLVDLVNVARRTPSAGNLQPLRYALVLDPDACARMFAHLKWAGALKDWDGPAEGERPVAYVIVLNDTQVSRDPGCDHGIACQSMLLAAAERGLGGCMLGAIDRDGIRGGFRVDDRYEILLVVALGVPAEQCVLEDAPPGGDITYYRDAQGVHHVPKRPLQDVIVEAQVGPAKSR